MADRSSSNGARTPVRLWLARFAPAPPTSYLPQNLHRQDAAMECQSCLIYARRERKPLPNHGNPPTFPPGTRPDIGSRNATNRDCLAKQTEPACHDSQ